MIFVIINLMRCMAEMREFEREHDYPYSNSRLLPRISAKHFSYFFAPFVPFCDCEIC